MKAMKRFLLLLPAALVLSCAPRSVQVPDSVAARWQDLPKTDLSWTPPLVSRYADTLRPGVVVYWVPDSSLPLASIQWVWPEGSLGLSDSDATVAGMLGKAMRKGGTFNLAPAQVDDTLEFLAAGISLGVGMVRTTASISGFSRDLPFLSHLLTDMIVSPRFDGARVEVLRAESQQGIEHRFDTPAQTNRLAWDRVANGRGPWTSLSDSGVVSRVGPDDFRRVLAGRFSPEHLWIAVAGQFDRAQVRALLLEQLDRLARGPSKAKPVGPLDSVPDLPPMAPPGVYVYDIPANQVQIRMGGRFLRRDHPDYYPVMLASQILGGGGFGSRLVEAIRSDEGLAYHVASWAGTDYDRPSTWGVLLQTKTPSTGRALYLVRREIQRLADSGFHAGELERARKGLSASIPTLFDTPENTADMLLQAGSWGRRDDHFRLYQRALDTIPEADVLAAFRKWFRPESLRIVISGPLETLEKPFADGSPELKTWGPIHRLDAPGLASTEPLPFESP